MNISGRNVVVKVSLSVLVGGAAYVVTSATGEPQIWALTMSIFLGGIALVIQFLIDFAEMLRSATEFHAVVELVALNKDPFMQLVRTSMQFDRSSDSVIDRFAYAEVARFSSILKSLADSRDLFYEGEDPNWLLGLTRSARLRIDATSISTVAEGGRGFVDEQFWQTDLGQRYLVAQREAIGRGVAVRRLFIMDSAELITDTSFLAMCRMHERRGVQVRALAPEGVSSALFDYIVFDDQVTYELRSDLRLSTENRPTIITDMRVHAELVGDRVRRFRELWDLADLLPTTPGAVALGADSRAEPSNGGPVPAGQAPRTVD